MPVEQNVNIAVALHWDGGAAPRVTAKGRGELAARIVELAREHGVPVDHEPELIEVLAQVELGDHIPEVLFVAVAEIIAFAYAVRGQLPAHLLARFRERSPQPAGAPPPLA